MASYGTDAASHGTDAASHGTDAAGYGAIATAPAAPIQLCSVRRLALALDIERAVFFDKLDVFLALAGEFRRQFLVDVTE